MMPVVFREGQAGDGLLLKFTDSLGAPLAPTTMKYRIDCDTNDQVVRDWTEIANPAAETTITLTATDTKIIDSNKEHESRRLTVLINEGLSTQYPDEFVFLVKNLANFNG